MTWHIIPIGRLIEQDGDTTRCYWRGDLVDYRGGKARAEDFALAGGERDIKLDDALWYAEHYALAKQLCEADKRCNEARAAVAYLTRQPQSQFLLEAWLEMTKPIDGVSQEAYDAAVLARDEADREWDRLMRDEIAPIVDAARRRLEAAADPIHDGIYKALR